jgi:hypothetical protein
MDYVAFLSMRSSVPAEQRDAAPARRAGWSYPAGIRVIAEYWPMAGARAGGQHLLDRHVCCRDGTGTRME